MGIDAGDDGRVSTRRRQTQDRLLDAAREVFAAKGVHGATVEEICEAAGFTRGAFYSNFADKDDLTRRLLDRERERLLSPITVDGLDVGHLAETIDTVLRRQSPDREFFLIQSEMSLLAVRSPELGGVAREADATFRSAITQILVAGMARLGLEPVVGVEDIADAVVAVSERSLKNGFLDPAPTADPHHLSRVVLPLLLGALTRRRADAPAPQPD